jgi:hypothetical protein
MKSIFENSYFLKTYIAHQLTLKPVYINNPRVNNMFVCFFCVVHLQGADTPSTEGIVAWLVISKQILLRL